MFALERTFSKMAPKWSKSEPKILKNDWHLPREKSQEFGEKKFAPINFAKKSIFARFFRFRFFQKRTPPKSGFRSPKSGQKSVLLKMHVLGQNWLKNRFKHTKERFEQQKSLFRQKSLKVTFWPFFEKADFGRFPDAPAPPCAVRLSWNLCEGSILP